ncbi:ArsR family transcriptional regulator [Citricoccus sp. SGAir0253]|uniref:helix-turn-helix transcriptional regulator n=1 Tax=Citricoccus sp. SGAir0253 TaxID=2567881 RepID=UPI0010CD6927|nr:helix-turn-helix domain-containing protein [Citricoccus sp. SGAir0253]QCU78036.1 ArsR family transcriptional regulator [Citricoccus sp. SGAir0253]
MSSPLARAGRPADGPDMPPGPAPTPEPAALGAARRRVLEAVTDAGPAGATIAGLARVLGGHANTVRHHLAALVAAGLVEEAAAPPAGRGRPARVFRVAPGADGTGAGAPEAAGYRELAAALVAVAPEHPGLVREAGRHWGAQVAARHPAPPAGAPAASVRQGLAGILDAQGFAAAEDAGGGLELRTCPLVAEAREHLRAVCGIHEAMLQGVLDAWNVPGRAELEPFALPHACRVVVRGATD